MNEAKPVDDRAIVSLVAGIVAVMFSMFALHGPMTLICLPASVIAIMNGVAVLKEGKGGRGLAVAGVVLGTIGICSWILFKTIATALALFRWVF
jgi:hypothetical protein